MHYVFTKPIFVLVIIYQLYVAEMLHNPRYFLSHIIPIPPTHPPCVTSQAGQPEGEVSFFVQMGICQQPATSHGNRRALIRALHKRARQYPCGGEFNHPLDLQGLRPGLDNLLAQSCDEYHQIILKQNGKKKGDGHFLLPIYLIVSYQAT